MSNKTIGRTSRKTSLPRATHVSLGDLGRQEASHEDSAVTPQRGVLPWDVVKEGHSKTGRSMRDSRVGGRDFATGRADDAFLRTEVLIGARVSCWIRQCVLEILQNDESALCVC